MAQLLFSDVGQFFQETVVDESKKMVSGFIPVTFGPRKDRPFKIGYSNGHIPWLPSEKLDNFDTLQDLGRKPDPLVCGLRRLFAHGS